MFGLYTINYKIKNGSPAFADEPLYTLFFLEINDSIDYRSVASRK
ncbi:MAG: hypothetical protein U0T81_06270 [Saprospiraceae bacterium]